MSNYVFINKWFDSQGPDHQTVAKRTLDFVVENDLIIQHVYDGSRLNVLEVLLDGLKSGDVIYVLSWKTLPNYEFHNGDLPFQIAHLLYRIRSKGAELCCIQENIDTGFPNDRLLLNQLVAFEQFNIDIQTEAKTIRPLKSPRIVSPRIIDIQHVPYSGHVGC